MGIGGKIKLEESSSFVILSLSLDKSLYISPCKAVLHIFICEVVKPCLRGNMENNLIPFSYLFSGNNCISSKYFKND